MHSILSAAFRVLVGLVGVLQPGEALATHLPALPIPPYVINPASFGPLCSLTGLCFGSTPIGFGLLLVILQDLVEVIRNVFVGVCVVYFAWFALMMIVRGSEEQAITEQRRAFGYSAVGMGIVGVASLLVQTFAPSSAGPVLVAPLPFTDATERIVDYITIATGAFLIFVISMAGFRIIVLQGNESEIEKQKKSFFNGLLGMIILLLARVTVQAIIPGTGTPNDLVVEAAGMVRFLLEIIAGLAVLVLIAAGFLFILSLQSDDRKQRARRILSSTVIVLLIVVLSHTLVATFIR